MRGLLKEVKGTKAAPKVPKVVKGTKVAPKVPKVVKEAKAAPKAAPKVPKVVKVIKGTKVAPKVSKALSNKLKKTKNVGGAYNRSSGGFPVSYAPPKTINMGNINYKPSYNPLRRAEPQGSMSYTSSSPSGKTYAESNAITEDEEERKGEETEERKKRQAQLNEHFARLAKEDEEYENNKPFYKRLYNGLLAKIGLEHTNEYHFPVRKIR